MFRDSAHVSNDLYEMYMNKIWAIILRIRLIRITSSGFNKVFQLVVSASEVAMIGLVMFKRIISRAFNTKTNFL